jgi:hypothetical protein
MFQIMYMRLQGQAPVHMTHHMVCMENTRMLYVSSAVHDILANTVHVYMRQYSVGTIATVIIIAYDHMRHSSLAAAPKTSTHMCACMPAVA